MYFGLTENEMRATARAAIENLEVWARRLIDQQLTLTYGANYFDAKKNDVEFCIKKEIREKAVKMKQEQPERFSRLVDTLFLDEILYFLLHPNFYGANFKVALDYIYPNNKEMARTVFNTLISIRNPLSHSNPISVRQAEQAICYSNDFVAGLKRYYKERGEEQVWNVPQVIRLVDSEGMQENDISNKLQNNFKTGYIFKVGDTYSLEAIVDPSFDENEYVISWRFIGDIITEGKSFTIVFENRHVSTTAIIECTVKSNKEWHKYQHYDHRINLHMSVLPI